MIIKPAMMNATIQRTQDFTTIKQQEDSKNFVAQSNAQTAVKKDVEHKLQDVRNKDNADYNQQKYDAKEKGKNEYFSQKRKGKDEDSEDEDDGKVILKKRSGLDMKV